MNAQKLAVSYVLLEVFFDAIGTDGIKGRSDAVSLNNFYGPSQFFGDKHHKSVACQVFGADGIEELRGSGDIVIPAASHTVQFRLGTDPPVWRVYILSGKGVIW